MDHPEPERKDAGKIANPEATRNRTKQNMPGQVPMRTLGKVPMTQHREPGPIMLGKVQMHQTSKMRGAGGWSTDVTLPCA